MATWVPMLQRRPAHHRLNKCHASSAVTLDYPKISDGIRGMEFIEAVVASSKANAAWTKLDV